MYLTAVLLLSFCCVALLYCNKSIQLKSFYFIVTHFAVRSFLVCFGLASTNKKIFAYIQANLAMTNTLRNKETLQNHGVFVIARPIYLYATNFSFLRPKQSEVNIL